MAERYSVRDDRRREEEERSSGRGRGERYFGEHGYGPGYDLELLRPLYTGWRDREGRSFLERAGDEARSWFGHEQAERRPDERFDERPHRERASSPAEDRFGDVRAADVMTRRPVAIHPLDSVERAARLMGEYDCGSLPVVNENGRLIGIVTDRDIALRIVGRGLDSRRARVDDCMSTDLIAGHEYDSIRSCLRQMSRHQIRRLPIVDDRDRLIGIVSQSDLARHAGRHPGWGERRAMADVLCAVSEPARAPRR